MDKKKAEKKQDTNDKDTRYPKAAIIEENLTPQNLQTIQLEIKLIYNHNSPKNKFLVKSECACKRDLE